MASESPTILVLAAHPDDAEFRSGGTLVLLAQLGWQIHIATYCMGDCGSMVDGPNVAATTRRREAEAAAARVGGVYHSLGANDLQLFDDNTMRGRATALIRAVRPACVITHFPVDYMADHDTASLITRTATFVAPMPNYVVGGAAAVPPTAGLVPLYYFGGPLGGTDYAGHTYQPDFYIDISAVVEEKAAMLACHASQRDWLRKQHGIDQYLEEMRAWDADAGAQVGVPYAEGFFRHHGHAYPQTPLLQEALAACIRVKG